MPARWQSSQRPLFVRTVWVDGRRHAVLSRDDPLLRYPRPSSTTASDTASETSTCCQLEDCLIKLRLALQPETYEENFQESIFPIQRGTVESSHCYDHDDSDSQCEEDHRLPLLGQYPKVYSFAPSEHPFLPLPELQLNPLSERVLQWLDLSGKGKRLSAAPPRVAETTREPKTADPRRTSTLRRRELPTRSLSVDVLANIKLSARSLNTHVRHRNQHPVIVTSPTSSEHEECRMKKPPEQPPVVQTFEPPRLLRPLSSWPQSSTPNRPQLHIFMPPLDNEVRVEETSECESTNEGM